MKNEFDNGKEDGFFTRAQLFYRIYGNAVANREKRYLSPSSKRTVAEAEEYIETHFRDRDLTVRKLADRCGVSESYFRRMFRNFFGTSPNRKIALVRLSLARRMMGDRPELSLSGIAEECGFCSVQYMTELFRREYGISPGKYRRERKRKTEQ
ncbi:MAG: AraC family transcriptional regulator [Clostridia bacterium]|nr:AraC family transcriptional regulator [Clostridia bacterium]